MSYNPYNGRYTYGGSLKHYRDKGSRNGYSKNPNYKPIGKKAVGRRLPDGTYVYDYRMPMSQKERNTERLRTLVTGEDRRGRGGDPIAIAKQRNRIASAIATNANLHGNTLGNKIGRTDFTERVKGKKAVTDARNIFQRGASAVGDWFSKRRAELKTTGKNIGSWLSDRGKDISRAAKSAYEAISNSDERRALEEAEARYKTDKSAASKFRLNQARKAYDSHLLTRLGRGSKSALDSARDFVSNQDEREAYVQAQINFKKNPTAENRKARDDAKRAYESHLLTRLDRGVKSAPGRLSKAVSQVGDFASNTASNAKGTATKIATYATEKAREASELISKLPSSAKSYYEGLVDNIKTGKTKSEIDAALIELQNNIKNGVFGPSSMPSDSYLDRIDPPVKKKKK